MSHTASRPIKSIQGANSDRSTVTLDKIDLYIINLDESRSRWIQCFRKMAGLFDSKRIHRVPAIDGRSFAQPQRPSAWQSETLSQLRQEGYLDDALVPDPIRTALCLSHQRALRTFLNHLPLKDGHRHWALILEDDAQPAEALLRHPTETFEFDIPADAELLFLHDRVLTSTAVTTPTDGITWRPVIGGIGLEAYLVSPAGARKMLQAWRPLQVECDIQLMTFARDYADAQTRQHIWDMLNKTQGSANLIHCYAPRRPLFQINESLPSVKLQLLGESTPPASPAPMVATTGVPAKPLIFDRSNPLAFATCWFNPCHYRSRLDNFLRFHEGMQDTNLVVVELAFGDDDWQLPDNLPNLIRLRSDTLCWQKEALLNHGLALLHQEEFPYLGWLDADIIFRTRDWQERLLEALQTKRLCQVFETVTTSFPDRGKEHALGAAAAWTKHGRNPLRCGVTGFGWAMQREVWQSARLFDLNLIGGGDHVMWRSAFYHCLEIDSLFADRTYPQDLATLRNQWATVWSSAIQQQMSYARNVSIQAQPHGNMHNRQYLSRTRTFRRTGFHFADHLARDQHGLLQWTDATPADCIKSVRQYFLQRREDDAG